MRLVMKHYSLIKNNWYILKKVYKFNRLLFFKNFRFHTKQCIKYYINFNANVCH